MTEHNAVGRDVVKDGIALAAYTMDSHNVERVVVRGMVKNEGNVEVGGRADDDLGGAVKVEPYPIAYRALTPRRSEVTNLLVPVALSASHIAFGSIRMEPIYMVLGQVAAVAASMAGAAARTGRESAGRRRHAVPRVARSARRGPRGTPLRRPAGARQRRPPAPQSTACAKPCRSRLHFSPDGSLTDPRGVPRTGTDRRVIDFLMM
jgi:hypothetical protein